MATRFGHNGRHQAIPQKLKKAGTFSAKCRFMWDTVYSYIDILCVLTAVRLF